MDLVSGSDKDSTSGWTMFNTIASFVDCYMQHAVAAAAEALAFRVPNGMTLRVVAEFIAAVVGGQPGEEPGLDLRLITRFEVERQRTYHWHQVGQKRVNDGAAIVTEKKTRPAALSDIQCVSCFPRANDWCSKAIQSFVHQTEGMTQRIATRSCCRDASKL